MRFLLCAAVLAAASAVALSVVRTAPGVFRPDPALAAVALLDGPLVEPVRFYGDRRDRRRREAMRRRAETRRRAEMRRRAEWRRRHGYHRRPGDTSAGAHCGAGRKRPSSAPHRGACP